MRCVNIEGTQTELEFYLTLRSRGQVGTCRGNLIEIALRGDALETVVLALSNVGASGVLNSALVETSPTGQYVYSFCAVHWLDVAAVVEGQGLAKQDPDWTQLSYLLLRQVCKALDWDYKELLNYIKSLTSFEVNG